MQPTFHRLTETLWITQSELFATNSGIFSDGAHACLIDPGIAPEAIAGIATFLTEAQLRPETLVITHAHWDHIMGPERFTGVPVIAHAGYPRVLQERGDDLRRQIARWETRAGIERVTPFVLPLADVTFETTYTLTCGALTLRLLHAPGHAPDQLTLYHAASGTLWAADMLSDLEIPLVSHSLAEYEHTLAQLAALDVQALVPGHGTPTTESTEIRARFTADRAYLAALRAHVTDALTAGYTIEETVAAGNALTYRQNAEENAGPHRLNVESAYLELGGAGDPTRVGWQQEWDES